jgi:hypothetical protein
MKEKTLVANQGETVFRFFLNKIESIGLAVTEDDTSYLILDSGDYWYDSIQAKYPSQLRCSCKSTLFTAKCRYFERIGTTEFDQIDLITKCISCGKEKTQVAFSLKYSPTEHLYLNPLTFCPKPKIKYKVSEITSFWTTKDAAEFVQYMASIDMKMLCWYFPEQKRVLSEVSLGEALNIIQNKTYLNFFFYFDSLKLNTSEGEKGTYFEEDVWRRQELIQLGSPYNMQYAPDRLGYLYYIKFCNEYIENYSVKSKSKKFEETTTKMVDWLRSSFYTERSKNSADNENEYRRLFG